MNGDNSRTQSSTRLLIDAERGWTSRSFSAASVGYPSGTLDAQTVPIPEAGGTAAAESLERWVSRQRPGFAVVLETESFVFAAVDKIRSHPLFYCLHDDGPVLSNSPRLLRRAFKLDSVDEQSLLELRMAGFVTGRDTVYEDLSQLLAGEALYWDRRTKELRRTRYYRYYPVVDSEAVEEELLDQLGRVTDRIMSRLVENAGTRPIWIPVSGGLDSRLVLAKLVDHGAHEVQAFSYGPKDSYDAVTGQKVARRLGVPWFHTTPSSQEVRDFFESERRRRYWVFADGEASVPSMSEIMVLSQLVDSEQMPTDAILVNGQTGDFISGSHIPTALTRSSADATELLNAVTEKHYSLWEDLKTPTNLRCMRARIRRTLEDALGEDQVGDGRRLASQYELWEWQERQSKYVVNGQRAYDFFKLDWELPLWDDEYLHFWPNVPLHMRVDRRLFKRYLARYDRVGLFSEDPPPYRPRATPGWQYYPIHGLRKILTMLGQHTASRWVRKHTRYFGVYRWQYQSYPYRFFRRHATVHRSPLSFFAESWVEENLGRELRA